MNYHVEKNQSKCPDFNTLAAYLDDSLDEKEKQLVDTHMNDCQRCQEIFSFGEMTRMSQVEVEQVTSQTLNNKLDPLSQKLMPFGQLSTGDTIGRYIIVKPLGLGGMGEVFLAYDPDLNRRVALKLLRTDAFADSSINKNVSRLLKEAQAMAQLSHPNVISVHDVLKVDGQVVIAMEYLSGGTLKTWLQAQTRSWREIVDVFVGAGQGLAAAHVAKLVHRDFKPANVLLGEDGRVCVTDFGLVRGLDKDENLGPLRSIAESNRLDESVTKTGAFVGTPAYMSPEQFLGEKSDTQSDQFCFCVALFEALYGQRPYQGETPEEIKESILSGKTVPIDESKRVPTWIHNIIRKGLEVNPEDRHPSMDVLLTELKFDPIEAEGKRRAMRNRRLGWVTVILLAVILPVGIWYGMRYRTVQLCKDTSREFSGVWDHTAKKSVKKAFLATGKPYAQGTWERVERNFDKYLADWTWMRSDVCDAKHIHGTESEELFDLRMNCLKKRKQELKALSKAFSNADAKVVVKAVRASSSLTDIDMCADENTLRKPYPPPPTPEAKERAAAIREKLVDVDMMIRIGRFQQGWELARRLKEEVSALDYRPVEAELLYWTGVLHEKVGEYKKSESEYIKTSKMAGVIKDPHLAAKALSRLVLIIGYQQARFKEGLLLSKSAETMIELAGGDESSRAHLFGNLGLVFDQQGKYDKATQFLHKALEINIRKNGNEHPNVAIMLNNIGIVYRHQGKYDEASQSYQRAIVIYEKTFGSEHPDLAYSLNNLGVVFRALGKIDKAIQSYRKSLSIWEKALGLENPLVAMSLHNLGNVHKAQGNYDKALGFFRRALEIRKKTLGPEHIYIASTLGSMGIVFSSQGNHDKALEYHYKSLAILEKGLGPEHSDLAAAWNNIGEAYQAKTMYSKALDNYRRSIEIKEKSQRDENPSWAITLNNMGTVFREQGKYTKALEYFHRALTIGEKFLGSTHPDLTLSLIGIGEVYVAQKKSKQAIAPFKRSVAICGTETCKPLLHGLALHGLARALVNSGGDKKRAIRMAKQAREVFEKAPHLKKELNELVGWLKKHDTSKSQNIKRHETVTPNSTVPNTTRKDTQAPE